MWSHIKPCLRAASDDPARFAGVRVLGVDEHVWHHQDRRRRGPRELTGIVDHSRGGSSHGAGSLPGTARTPSTISSKTPPASSTPSISSSSPAMLQVRCVAASSKTRPVTVDARGIPSIRSGFFCAPRVIGSRSVNKNDSVRASWQMRRISVSTSPTFTGQVREVFHQAIPAQGQRLAARLVESLPRCPVPEIARLGANPTQVEGRLLGLLRYRRSQQRLHGSHQRTLSSWADESPEATSTPPATNSECSSSQEA